jgi:hypothetical protein
MNRFFSAAYLVVCLASLIVLYLDLMVWRPN